MSLRPSITGIDLKKFMSLFGSCDESIVANAAKMIPVSDYRTQEFRGGQSIDYFGRTKTIPIEELEKRDDEDRQKIIRAVRAIIMGDVSVYHAEKTNEEKGTSIEKLFEKIVGYPLEFFANLASFELTGIRRIFQYPIQIIGLAGSIVFGILTVLFAIIFFGPRLLFWKKSNDESEESIEAVGYLADTQEIFCPATCTSIWKHGIFEEYLLQCRKGMDKRIDMFFQYLQFGRPFFAMLFNTSWSYYAYLTYSEANELLEYIRAHPKMTSDDYGFGKDLQSVLEDIVAAKKDLWLYAS